MRKKCGEIFMCENDYFTYVCFICEASFREVENYLFHIRCSHSNKFGNFVERNNEEQLQNLPIDNDDEIYELSDYTAESYSLLSTLIIESCGEESTDEKDSLCDDVPVIIESSNGLPINIELCENSDNEQNIEENLCEPLSSEEKEIVSEKVECNTSNRKFTTQNSFRIHIKNSLDCTQKLNDTENNSKKCQFCNRCFSSVCRRESHETLHTGEKRLLCEICGLQFRHLQNLRMHKSSHLTVKPYKCQICNAAFKNPVKLRDHKLRHGEKKYLCSYCKRGFYTNAEKKNHERTHTDEKPFKCDICGKSFKTDYLHKKTCLKRQYNSSPKNNNNNVKKKFYCPICNAQYTQSQSLNRHGKTQHSDIQQFQCPICDENTDIFIEFCYHMRSHSTKQVPRNSNEEVLKT